MRNNKIKEFFKKNWEHVGEENPFKDTIAFDCISSHVDALLNDEFDILVLVMPPKTGKTRFISGMLPAYLWVKDLSKKSYIVSNDINWAYRNLYRNKHLIDQFILSQKEQNPIDVAMKNHCVLEMYSNCKKDKGGKIWSTSVFWGNDLIRVADLIIFDDIDNLDDIEDKSTKQKTKDYLLGNLCKIKKGAKVILTQHKYFKNDVVDEILKLKDVRICYVNLPIEYDAHRHTQTISKKDGRVIWEDPRKENGELLLPESLTKESLSVLKDNLSKSAYSAFYQGET
jgi:hypothetical protein